MTFRRCKGIAWAPMRAQRKVDAVHPISALKRGLRRKGVVGNTTQQEHIRLCFKWDGGLTTRLAAGRKTGWKEADHGADRESGGI